MWCFFLECFYSAALYNVVEIGNPPGSVYLSFWMGAGLFSFRSLLNIDITFYSAWFHFCNVLYWIVPVSKHAQWLFVRLLEWLPDVQEDVGWIKEQTVKLMNYILQHARRNVSQQLVGRWETMQTQTRKKLLKKACDKKHRHYSGHCWCLLTFLIIHCHGLSKSCTLSSTAWSILYMIL